MINKKLSIAIASVIMAVLPAVTLAACPIALDAVTSANAGEWFKCLIIRLLNLVVWPLFIAAAIIMFIWAGFLFLNSHGDPTKVADARKAVTYGVIGVVVGLLGYSIVGVLRGVLNL